MITLTPNSRLIIAAIILLIIGMVVGGMLAPDAPKSDDREEIVKALRKEITAITEINRGLKNSLLSLDDSIIIQNNRLQEKDVEISTIKGRHTGNQERIQKLTTTEADSILNVRFPDKEKKSKEILRGLAQGEEARELLNVSTEKIEILEQKGLHLETQVGVQAEIIINLEEKIEHYEEIVDVQADQIKDLKKAVKKQKRQKRLIIITGGVLLIASLFAK